MRLARFVVPIALLLSTACGGDSTGPGSGNLTNGTFTMQVSGGSFAAVSAIVLVTGNITSIGAGTANNHSMGMAWVDAGPGTYTIPTSIGANATYGVGNSGTWTAGSGSGSGSITITTRTATRVAGNFSFVMEPVANSGATGNKTISGSFDLTF